MDMRAESTEQMQRRQRLEVLMDRFVAVSMRSRTLRLGAPSQRSAFDLARVASLHEGFWSQFCEVMGRDEDGRSVELVSINAGDELERKMSSDLHVLHKAALDERVESGADTLGVGWPFIKGVSSDGTWFRAPLFIYPVELSKTKQGRLVWQISPSGAAFLNDALVQVMARHFGVKWSFEHFAEQDSDGVISPDVSTWQDLQEALMRDGLNIVTQDAEREVPRHFVRWTQEQRASAERGSVELCFEAILGRFPLAATSVILDYHELLDGQMSAERLGAALHLVQIGEGGDLDARDDVESGFKVSGWRPFLSDSSQDAVISHVEGTGVGSSEGIVVQGPPGTGKSQLISNMLCEFLASGKTALVVCQKRAALDVVASRLSVLGLHEALGVVHDVRRDRNLFCHKLASTLTPLLHVDESQRKLDDFRRGHAQDSHKKAMREVDKMLGEKQQAWRILLGVESDRPGLLSLEEKAFDEPEDADRLCVDLGRFAWQISEQMCVDEMPHIQRLAAQARPFVIPHPWSDRLSMKSVAEGARLAEFKESLASLESDLKVLVERDKRGTMSPDKSCEYNVLWSRVQVLLELLEEGNEEALDDFALFWTWCDGEDKGGTWRALTERLKKARKELIAVPWSLVLCRQDELENWIELLTELKHLKGKWWRFFSPTFWRLKKVPGEVLEVVFKSEGYEEVEASGEGAAGLPVDLVRLCEGAIAWQAFIADLPEDNAFFDFGFQGDPEQIDDALNEVKSQVELVQQVHLVQKELSGEAEVYEVLPEVWSVLASGVGDLPFFAALQADARGDALSKACERGLDVLTEILGKSWVELKQEQCRTGQAQEVYVEIRRRTQCVDELDALSKLDVELSQRPDFVDYFLRRFQGSVEASVWFEMSVERAWRSAWIERGGGEKRLSEVIAGDEYQARLMGSVDGRRAHAADALLARYRGDLQKAAQDSGRRKELQQLLTQARKQRYRLTLRQMVDQFWEGALRMARPIWLCSPDSVASLFPLEMGLFDVVIFDEASQCPVESAMGALVRGKRVVIAGDDQQMPPSHFFSASVQDFDDDEVAEESLLASDSLIEAARQSFEQITLRWHYRSKHEALIAFSNMAFYGNKLKTAPGALSVHDMGGRPEGLMMRRVDGGLWSEQSNSVEAKAVVEEIKSLLLLEEPPSIGVVTFNLKQAECIERVMQEKMQEDAEFLMAYERDKLKPLTEQLFVRNLENVQGDERDVMLMSVGYAPTEEGGRVMARFGPLGQEGGEKRLNVAITRAREAYLVFCSFDPEELDVSGTKNLGPKLLKQFLCYAQGVMQEQTRATAALENAAKLVGGKGVVARRREVGMSFGLGERVKEELYGALSQRGYRVEREVGMGDLHMDLAVYGAQGSRVAVDITRFIGIPDVMTREVYTPRFWERAGWKVLRVTAFHWRHMREDVLEQIEHLLAGGG